MKKISLIQMEEGRKGKVSDIAGGPVLHNKFMSMGIYKGREIVKLSHFALRGPVTIKVGRSTLALGHSMAAKITVSIE